MFDYRCEKPLKDEWLDDVSMERRVGKVEELEGCVAVAWRCPLLEKTFGDLASGWSYDKIRKIDTYLLSIFIMIDLKKISSGHSLAKEDVIPRAREALTRFIEKSVLDWQIPHRSSFVEILSTPFGNPVFIDSISRGIVSNVLGEAGCVILTDTNAVPGSEGAPVYLTEQESVQNNILFFDYFFFFDHFFIYLFLFLFICLFIYEYG